MNLTSILSHASPCLLGLCLLVGLGETHGLQFLYPLYMQGGDALALGLIALGADKRLGIQLRRLAALVGPTEGDLQPRIGGIGEQQQTAVLVLARKALRLSRGLQGETLDIGKVLLVGIEEYGAPHLVGHELLYAQYAVLIISNNQNDVKSAFESFINQE